MTTSHAFWGKTHTDETGTTVAYDLRKHLLDTAGAAFALWDRWLRPGLRAMLTDALAPGDPDRARRIVAAVAGLHDIGKANPIFQTQQLSSRGLPPALADVPQTLRDLGYSTTIPDGAANDMDAAVRHEAASQAILGRFPSESAEAVHDRWASAVVGGHHGRFHPGLAGECDHTREALDALVSGPGWVQAHREITDLVLEATGTTLGELREPLRAHEGAAVVLLSGFVIVADWVASDSLGLVSGYDDNPEHDPLGKRGACARYVKAANRAYARLLPSTIGVYKQPANPRVAVMGTSKLPLYPLQEAAGSVGRGLWIVAETTGSGKTESAMLRHMNEHGGEGVLWGLPTRATTDKMWDRVKWMYRRTGNVGSLLHAHRSLNGHYLAKPTDGPDLRYSAWATEVLGNVKPLLSPVAVGTIDQILLGALRQKWATVRLLAIANSHVIIDEAHLMDEYQVQLCEELLHWWGLTDTRVTMLSASLPQALTQRFATAYNGTEIAVDSHYPAHTVVHRGTAVTHQLRTARDYVIDIDHRKFTYAEGETPSATFVRHAVAAVLEHRRLHPTARIAVIANRVGHVQDIAQALMHEGIPDVTTMHSRMAAAHRTVLSRDLEDIAGKRSRIEGAIVVGTQVIEASLDLDFDVLITELAPASALIQRAGRQWRSSQVAEGTWGEHWHARPTKRPKLIIISHLEPSSTTADDPAAAAQQPRRPSEALALPYSYGSLYRTFASVDALGGELRIPADVQSFVDAAHFDLSDTTDLAALRAGEDLRAQSAEGAAAMHRVLMASEVTIHARDPLGPFEGNLTFTKLGRLTEPDPQTEASTRYADYAQLPVLIVDPYTHGRWSWRGDADDARVMRALATRAPREVGVLLGLTIQVPEKSLGRSLIPLIDIADRFDRDISPFRASELRGVVPVRLAAGAHYDERLGLVGA